MTTRNYSIADVRDLLNSAKNTLVFINSGVPSCLEDSAVQLELLSYLEDTVAKANSILDEISGR